MCDHHNTTNGGDICHFLQSKTERNPEVFMNDLIDNNLIYLDAASFSRVTDMYTTDRSQSFQ
jgi:hypothetical protein